MSDILKYNISRYNDPKNTEYLEKEYHAVRINESLNLIMEEVDKISLQDRNKFKLLSLGCSTGVVEEKIKRQTCMQIYGLEASARCSGEATKRGIQMSIGDVSEKFPFKDETFNFVFAGEIIEHLIDTRQFLEEISRVLKPNGFLILTTPNLARIDDRIKFIFGKAPRHTNPMHEYLFLHIRPFTFGSLRDALSKTNFKLISFKSNFVAANVGSKSYKSRILAKLLPSWGGTLIVKAQKA